jgi:hypothetical protein
VNMRYPFFRSSPITVFQAYSSMWTAHKTCWQAAFLASVCLEAIKPLVCDLEREAWLHFK